MIFRGGFKNRNSATDCENMISKNGFVSASKINF